MARKLTETVQLKLRFSEALRRKLERAASERSPPHSMNSEIIRRLEESFQKEDQATIAEQAADKALAKVGYAPIIPVPRRWQGLPETPNDKPEEESSK